jgi:hypothetical protein
LNGLQLQDGSITDPVKVWKYGEGFPSTCDSKWWAPAERSISIVAVYTPVEAPPEPQPVQGSEIVVEDIFFDADGDGLDDSTGLTQEEWELTQGGTIQVIDLKELEPQTQQSLIPPPRFETRKQTPFVRMTGAGLMVAGVFIWIRSRKEI